MHKQDMMNSLVDTTAQTISDAMDSLKTDEERRVYIQAILLNLKGTVIMQVADDPK